MAEKKDTVILSTSDDEQFTVERKVAERSMLIKSMLEGEYTLSFALYIPLSDAGPASRLGRDSRVRSERCHHL